MICKEESQQNRWAYIDALRVVAIFAVLLVHTDVASYYSKTSNIIEQIISLILGLFSRIGVPLFFMISGALLLKKEESYKVILTKRVFRYIIVLLVFSFVQYVFLGGDPNSNTYSGWKDKSLEIISHNGLISYFVTFFKSIWSKPIIAQYWFLYSYIDFLLLLPLLRRISKNSDSNLIRYIVLGSLIVNGVLPELQTIFGMGKINLNNSAFQVIVVYPLVGDYIANNELKFCKTVQYYVKLIAAFFVCNILLFLLEYRVFGLQYFRPDNFTIVYVILLFVIFKKFNNCFEKKRTILYISSAAFGIYLTEFILHALHYDLYIWYAKYIPYMLAICIRNIISIIIGTVIFNIIKKGKLFKKFI